MKRNSTRIVSFLIAMLMLLLSVFTDPIPTYAASSGTKGDIQWELSTDGTLTISSSSGQLVDIPASENLGFPKLSVRKIVIDSTIRSIGKGPLQYCNNLESISIPDSVKAIESKAFYLKPDFTDHIWRCVEIELISENTVAKEYDWVNDNINIDKNAPLYEVTFERGDNATLISSTDSLLQFYYDGEFLGFSKYEVPAGFKVSLVPLADTLTSYFAVDRWEKTSNDTTTVIDIDNCRPLYGHSSFVSPDVITGDTVYKAYSTGVKKENIIVYYRHADTNEAFDTDTVSYTWLDKGPIYAKQIKGYTVDREYQEIWWDPYVYGKAGESGIHMNLAGGNVDTIPGENTSDYMHFCSFYYTPISYPYIVKYIDKETGQSLLDDKLGQADYDSTVTENAPDISGYTVDDTSKSIVMSDANNTITFYYSKSEISYRVEYVDLDGKPLIDDKIVQLDGEDTVIENAVPIYGYTVDDEEKSLNVENNKDNVITFVYSPKDESSDDGKGYFSDHEIITVEGTIGSVVGETEIDITDNRVDISINNKGNKSAKLTSEVLLTVPVSEVDDPDNIALYSPEVVTIKDDGTYEIKESAIPLDTIWEQEGDNYIFTLLICKDWILNGNSELEEYETENATELQSEISDSKQISFYVVDKTNTLNDITLNVHSVLNQYRNDGGFYDEWISEDQIVNIPNTTFAIEMFKYNYYSDISETEGYMVSGFSDTAVERYGNDLPTDIVIPDTYDDGEHGVLPVIGVESGAFANSSIIKVQLPDTACQLSGAFQDCTSLKEVNILEGVTSLSTTFENCTSLETVEIPNTVINMGRTFQGCTSLKEVSIPDGVSFIEYTFDGCSSLERVNVPATVDGMYYTFQNCTSLKEVNLSEGISDVSFGFQNCTSLENIEIPNTVTDMRGAFENCISLKEVSIPEGVESIQNTFNGCSSLESIVIPETVSNINYAFRNCTSLKEVNIPEGVKNLWSTFSGCSSLEEIILPEGIKSLSSTFYGCTSLESIEIPNTVTDMKNTFRDCTSLKEVNIPEGVTSLVDTFKSCTSLENIEIPNTVINMAYTFTGCKALIDITIDNTEGSISGSPWGAPNDDLVITYLR